MCASGSADATEQDGRDVSGCVHFRTKVAITLALAIMSCRAGMLESIHHRSRISTTTFLWIHTTNAQIVDYIVPCFLNHSPSSLGPQPSTHRHWIIEFSPQSEGRTCPPSLHFSPQFAHLPPPSLAGDRPGLSRIDTISTIVCPTPSSGRLPLRMPSKPSPVGLLHSEDARPSPSITGHLLSSRSEFQDSRG